MGFGTDMNLPPSFTPSPQFGEGFAEAAEALVEGEVVERDDGEGQTKKTRSKKTKEGSSSEKADNVKAATGDKIVSGVDGGQSGGGQGGSGGGQQGQGYSMNAADPDLPAADLNLLINGTGEVTSAIRALAMSMAMASVGETKANGAKAESLLNQLYQGLDSSIDETNFKIIEAKLAQAKEKRIEAEKKAAQSSGIFGAIMGIMCVVLAVVCLICLPILASLALIAIPLLLAAAVALPVISFSGGAGEGGTIGAMASTFGFDDTAAGREMFMVVAVILLSVVTLGIAATLLPVVLSFGAAQREEEQMLDQAQRGLFSADDISAMARSSPAQIKEALMEAGLEEEQAEFQAYLMAMILVLMMMMAMAGATGALPSLGEALGNATAGTGQGADGASSEGGELGLSEEGMGGPDGQSLGPDEGFGKVDLNSFGDLGETFGEVGDESVGSQFNTGASYKNLLANKPFGNPDGTFSPEFAMNMAKESLADVDLNAIFSDMKGMLSELGYPQEVLDDPSVQSYLDQHGQALAEMVTGVTLGQIGEMVPTGVYISSLEEVSDAEQQEQAAVEASRLSS